MLLTLAFVFNTLLALLVILIHYEVLFQLDKRLVIFDYIRLIHQA